MFIFIVCLLINRGIDNVLNRPISCKLFVWQQKKAETFGGKLKKVYLCTRNSEEEHKDKDFAWICECFFAEIAQLVEHNLAKVGVAGPSPVFRSNIRKPLFQRLLLFMHVSFFLVHIISVR